MLESKQLDENWIDREAEAQRLRTHPVWENEPWWILRADPMHLHFTHVSATDRTLLAYTQNADKGRRNIQTPIKPGRYLSKYFGNLLTEKQIAEYAQWQVTGQNKDPYKALEVHFAYTSDEIVEVYQNGPSSCMDDKHFPDVTEMPVRVYGAGDLAIAYLVNPDNEEKVIARALVWPGKKVFGRVYPTPDCYYQDGYATRGESEDVHESLKLKLRNLGYSTGSFDGARLLKIECDDGFLMPYLDSGYMVSDCGDCWHMRQHGEFSANETSGYIRGYMEDDEPYSTCERCGDSCDTEDNAYSAGTHLRTRGTHVFITEHITLCSCCFGDHTFTCDGLGETLYNNSISHIVINGDTYSQEWAEANGGYYCDKTDQWYFPDEEPSYEMDDGDTWCQTAFLAHGFTCKLTNANYPNDEMHWRYDGFHRDCEEQEIIEWIQAQPQYETIPDERQMEWVA
jgi:hypothetical protein